MAAGITRLDEDNIYIVKANGFVEMPTVIGLNLVVPELLSRAIQ